MLKNFVHDRSRFLLCVIAGLAAFGLVCLTVEPFAVPWLYGAALGTGGAVAYVLAGGRSVGEAALAATVAGLLIVGAVLVWIVLEADDPSALEVLFVLTYLLWWVLGVAIYVLFAPAALCSVLVVLAANSLRRATE